MRCLWHRNTITGDSTNQCEREAAYRGYRGLPLCLEHHTEFKKLRRDERLKQNPYLRRALPKYKVEPDAYLLKIRLQRGHCLICRKRFGMPHKGKIRGKALVIDHDHKTGAFRGLICGKCNTLLGMAFDDPNILMSAVLYLTGRLTSSDAYAKLELVVQQGHDDDPRDND